MLPIVRMACRVCWSGAQQGCPAQTTAQLNSVAPSRHSHQGVGETAVGRVVPLNELALEVGGGLQQLPDQACGRGGPRSLRQTVQVN